MNNIFVPIKSFSADGVVSFPSSIPILPHGHSLGGILEQVVPVGRGLVCIRVSGMECMADGSLQESLAGRQAAICWLAGHLGAGILPAEVAR
jgi:hypothetical protein